MGGRISTIALAAALGAAILPAMLHAQDAVFLPCLSPRGSPDALRANFTANDWAELTTPEDRLLAAQAIGELRFLVQLIPGAYETAADLDETLRRMHQGGEREAELPGMLYFRRGDDFAAVASAGLMLGSGTAVFCTLIGPDLAGVREAFESAQANTDGRPRAVRSQRIEMSGFGVYEDLRIFAVEHLFNVTPTEPMYGPLSIDVRYNAADQ